MTEDEYKGRNKFGRPLPPSLKFGSHKRIGEHLLLDSKEVIYNVVGQELASSK